MAAARAGLRVEDLGGGGRAPSNDGTIFVGRARELALLEHEVAAVRGGAPRIVLVEGPPGIGKSSLVAHFRSRRPDLRGVAVPGDEVAALQPYGVLHQLIERLGVAAGSLGAEPGADPLVVGSRLLQVLGQVSADAGALALVVDDCQWVDAPSMATLVFAVRRLVAEPVLLLLVGRTGTPWPDGLLRFVGGGAGRHLDLGGLEPEDLVTLGSRVRGRRLGAVVGERMHEHTGGNPLHAVELFRELDEAALYAGTDPLPAPRSLASLVSGRLRACPSSCQDLVRAAAVLGMRCRLALAARLADVDDPVEALQHAVDAHLLEAVGSPPGETIAFPHALVRGAVYHELGPAARSQLHHRAAALIDGPEAVDHRVAGALVEDAALAAEVAALARREAESGATAAAAAHLTSAARLTPDPGDRERLHLEAITCLLRAGEVGAAATLAEQGPRLTASRERSFALGMLAFFGGRQAEAERLLTEVWELRDPDGDAELTAQAAGFLAQLCSIQVRGDDTIRWAERALAVSGDPYRAPAFSVLVCHLWFAGHEDEAMRRIGGIPSEDTGPTRRDADLLLVRGLIRMWADDRSGAWADLTAAVEASRPLLASRSGLIALAYRAEAAFRQGSWDTSIADATLAVSLSESTDQTWTSAFVHSLAALPLAGRGRWPEAERHVHASTRAAAMLGDAASVGHAASAAAFLAFCRRRPRDVVAAVEPALDHERRTVIDHPGVHYGWEAVYAEALVRLGRRGLALEVLDSFASRAAARSLPISQADADRVRGLLAALDDDVVGASRSFEAALGLLAGVRAPFERAVTGLAYGEALRRGGARRAARRRLEEARDGFRRLGARPFIERCDRELAAGGLEPARRSAPDARWRLTPQELTVARLVAAGATNREVAEELVISTKTVEYHLGGIFRKLAITSRRQLASRLLDEPV